MRAATIGRILVAVALVALAVVGAAPARAGDRASDFRVATRLYADGDLDAAQAAFEAVAAADPRGPWADDALSEAANVAEKRGDLDAARRLWRRVVDEYPQSRQSRRARARLAAIEAEIGAGGQWLEVAEQHEAILRAAIGVSDPTPQARALAALVAAHPDYPRAPEARLWIGDTLLRVGEV
ncbi:MAG: tetratricopeptide repeat protein, partial [Myxococcales bacterium]|nr:tetratricopeptide repeat protein [Myxococcales bacterium]